MDTHVTMSRLSRIVLIQPSEYKQREKDMFKYSIRFRDCNGNIDYGVLFTDKVLPVYDNLNDEKALKGYFLIGYTVNDGKVRIKSICQSIV